ncbi:MAG: response regulator [Candidatus Sulfotelmatobacter sp.]
MSLKRILVVDDELQMRRVLRASLSAHGYQVVEAGSGEEALNKLNVERCGFVLLDLNLPGLDGIATCRAIRADSSVPIIVVSIRDSEKDKAAARGAGADDYITKPFGIEQLLIRIREVSCEWFFRALTANAKQKCNGT